MFHYEKKRVALSTLFASRSQFGLGLSFTLAASFGQKLFGQTTGVTFSQNAILAKVLAQTVFILVLEVPVFDIRFVLFYHLFALHSKMKHAFNGKLAK